MCIRIIYENTKDQVPLRPLLGKQKIQAKEVYSKVNTIVIVNKKFLPGLAKSA